MSRLVYVACISYQDYHCSDEEKHMECEVDPEMTITAVTNAKWWVTNILNLDKTAQHYIHNMNCFANITLLPGGEHQVHWCAAPSLYTHKRVTGITITPATIHGQLRPNLAMNMKVKREERPSMMSRIQMQVSLSLMNRRFSKFCHSHAQPCMSFKQAGRTDVEGCCWWGRGVIQTSGIWWVVKY